jgi:hypothetical protein
MLGVVVSLSICELVVWFCDFLTINQYNLGGNIGLAKTGKTIIGLAMVIFDDDCLSCDRSCETVV